MTISLCPHCGSHFLDPIPGIQLTPLDRKIFNSIYFAYPEGVSISTIHTNFHSVQTRLSAIRKKLRHTPYSVSYIRRGFIWLIVNSPTAKEFMCAKNNPSQRS